MDNIDIRKNGDGYSDHTVYNAIKNIEEEDARFRKLLCTIFYSSLRGKRAEALGLLLEI